MTSANKKKPAVSFAERTQSASAITCHQLWHAKWLRHKDNSKQLLQTALQPQVLFLIETAGNRMCLCGQVNLFSKFCIDTTTALETLWYLPVGQSIDLYAPEEFYISAKYFTSCTLGQKLRKEQPIKKKQEKVQA